VFLNFSMTILPPAMVVSCCMADEMSPCFTENVHMQCESKKVAPIKLFCNIFTQAKYISVKFCQFIASIYPHMLTTFGRFNLIFNKMALIFLGVLIAFTVSSFDFQQVRLTSSLLVRVAPINPTLIHWIIRFVGNAGVLTKLQHKPKPVPEF